MDEIEMVRRGREMMMTPEGRALLRPLCIQHKASSVAQLAREHPEILEAALVAFDDIRAMDAEDEELQFSLHPDQ